METNNIPTTTKKTETKKGKLNAYIRYTGVGMQILGSMLLGVFGGLWLDKYFNNTSPWFTIILTPLSILIVLYSVSKEFLQKK